MKWTAQSTLIFVAAMHAHSALAGPLDPECTPGKAAKSAATKATVGVGGRCDAKEAASDSAKNKTGVDDKGRLEKRQDDDENVAKRAAKKAVP